MRITLIILALLVATLAHSQHTTHQLSTHVLDILSGKPGENVVVKLNKYDKDSDTWSLIGEKVTDKDGRIRDFLPYGNDNTGLYKLVFYTRDYYNARDIKTFYPFIEVNFEVENDEHLHVPITLSPFGYSTYRGS